MKSAELLQLTASEPLSLEQEYEMQKSWREDEDKCTFIILNKEAYTKSGDEVEAMIGDTNLFKLSDGEAEVEIMIAEESARGQRLGWESLLIMIRYGIEILKIPTFQAKIKKDNF